VDLGWGRSHFNASLSTFNDLKKRCNQNNSFELLSKVNGASLFYGTENYSLLSKNALKFFYFYFLVFGRAFGISLRAEETGAFSGKPYE